MSQDPKGIEIFQNLPTFPWWFWGLITKQALNQILRYNFISPLIPVPIHLWGYIYMIYFTPFIAVGAHNSTLLGVKFHPSETPLFSFIFNHVYGYYLHLEGSFLPMLPIYIYFSAIYFWGRGECRWKSDSCFDGHGLGSNMFQQDFEKVLRNQRDQFGCPGGWKLGSMG